MNHPSDIKQCAVCKRQYATEHDYLTKTSRWRLCSLGNLWFNCVCGSTLMIKKGKFPWYSPEKSLGAGARSVFNRLGNLNDLPHIPAAAMEIQKLLEKTDVEPREIAREVRKEPLIASQILQMGENIRNARSPGTARFKTLEHAIVYIGYQALKDLIISSSLHTMPLPQSNFKAPQYWREAHLSGAIAEFLMRRFSPQLNQDEVFLAGSLCNIGKLVMAFCFPPLINKILDDVSGHKEPLMTWRQAEASYQFPDHCVLGEIATALWGFPTEIVTAIQRHHVLESTATRPLDISEITAVANQMTHWVLLRPHRMEEGIINAFATRAGLNDSQIASLAQELTKLQVAISGSTQAA